MSVGSIVLAIVVVGYVGTVAFVSWLLWSAIQRHRGAPSEEG